MTGLDVSTLDTVDPLEALGVDGPLPADVARALVLRARAQRITGLTMTVAEAEAWYAKDRSGRASTE